MLYSVIQKLKNEKKNQTTVHRFFEIAYIIDGSGNIKINNKNYSVAANDIILLPPNTYHQEETGIDELLILYTGFLINGSTKLKVNPGLIKHGDFQLINCFRSIIWEINHQYEERDGCISNYLQLIMTYIFRYFNNARKSPAAGDNNIITDAITYFNEHFQETINVNILSKRYNLNKNYFSNIFKKKTGFPPVKYINEIRIDVAKKMLLNKKLTIKTISDMIGFQDPYYFSRIFKKITGIAPQQFRKQV